MIYWLLMPVVAVLSALLTGVVRRYALARGVLDLPNSRSSHAAPTPRGGGISIVVTFLAALLLLAVSRLVERSVASAFLGAGLAVAAAGFLDDHRSVPARWRLLAHFGAAVWALALLGGLPPLGFFGVWVNLGWFGHLLATLYLVWMLNLYNFMDGIDGIAGLEAVTVCIGAALIYAVRMPENHDWALPALLAMATLGCLVWIWPPARIFLGDVGSGFLGLTLGVMSIQAAWHQPALFWSWVILLGVFVVDATVTLIRRLIRGERLYEAHRTHAYQNAARQKGSHKSVTVAAGLINILWLLPLALAVATGHVDGVVGVLVAYGPLVWLAIHYRAGEPC
jgi:Fuc2NAc and GlcNAc transferase